MAHAPAARHAPGQVGDLFQVALGAGGDDVEHHLLGGHAAERADDPAAQVLLGVRVLVGVRRRERDAQRAPPRHDGDLADRVGAGLEHPQQRVPALVVRRPAALLVRHDERAFRPELHLLQRIREIGAVHLRLSPLHGEERGLVGEVGEIGTGHPRGRTGHLGQVHVPAHRDLPGVDLQDRLPARPVRRADLDDPVEAAGPGECRVEHVRTVGRREHDHALRAGEAVHLREDLVERLLALVVPAHARAAPAGPSDGVDLVDEHDGGRDLARLGEQLPDPARADAHDHLDELRGRGREERHPRLPRDRPRQQRLARAGRAREQHSPGHPGAHLPVGVRVLQEVDDIVELALDLVDARHVLERRTPVSLQLHRFRRGLAAEAAHAAAHPAARHPAGDEHPQQDEQQHRGQRDQQVREEAAFPDDGFGGDRDVVLDELRPEVVVGEGGPLRDELGVLVVLARDLRLLLELPLDGVALGVDLGDVARGDLLAELRVRDRRLVLAVEEGEHQIGDQIDGQRGQQEPAPASRHLPAGRRGLRGTLGAPGLVGAVAGRYGVGHAVSSADSR